MKLLYILIINYITTINSLKLNSKNIFTRRQLNNGLLSSLTIPSVAVAEETNIDKSNNENDNDNLNEFWTISDLYTNIKQKKVNLAAISNKNDQIKVLDVYGKSHVISILESEIPILENLMQKNKH